MDTYLPLRGFLLYDFVFTPSRYQIFQDGRMVDSGEVIACIIVKSKNDFINGARGKITITMSSDIGEDALKLRSVSEYDFCMTLGDRLMVVIFPEKSNVSDLPFIRMLKSFGICDYTRAYKYFDSDEPVFACIYTDNGNPVKMSFTTPNPERMIEFY